MAAAQVDDHTDQPEPADAGTAAQATRPSHQEGRMARQPAASVAESTVGPPEAESVPEP
jgi:hypothetical protein